jgi:C-terminal peptidase prc
MKKTFFHCSTLFAILCPWVYAKLRQSPLLPILLLLTVAACADRSLDADIVKVFGRHSYGEHAPQKIIDALKSRGAGGLAALDSHAAVVSALKKIEKLPGAVSSGLLLGRRGGGLYVFKVFQKSSGAAANLKDGDRILEINGVPAAAADIFRSLADSAAFRLKAERRTLKGASVMTAAIKKEYFSFPAVFGFYEPATQTAFVRIGMFYQGAGGVVAAGLDALTGMGAKKIIFDLRDNPGGVPAEAAGLLKEFAPKAGPVLEVKSRHQGYCQFFEAPGRGKYASLKAAVLVNSGTARAAEVFAAALNELTGAPVVGEPTRGDVSLTKTFNLGRSKKGLKLTVARIFPPSGADLEGKGVRPDFDPGLTPGEIAKTRSAWAASGETALLGDAAYDKAMEVLNK